MLTGKDVGWVPETLALRARSLPSSTRRLPSQRRHSDLAVPQAAVGATVSGLVVQERANHDWGPWQKLGLAPQVWGEPVWLAGCGWRTG